MLVFWKSFYQALRIVPDLSDTSISAQCKADFPSEHTHGAAVGAEDALTSILQGKHKPSAVYNKSAGSRSQFCQRERSSVNWQRGWYRNAREVWFCWEKCPSRIFNYSGYLWLVPNWQTRKCKVFLHSARIISMQEPEAVCLEQLFIIQKIKMMYCLLYSISRNRKDHNTWNIALPRLSYQ